MDHGTFLDDLGVRPPERLRALLLFLAGGNVTLCEPTDRRDLHPLLIPLARDDHDRTWGLLCWPNPPDGMPMPVVRQEGARLELLGRSVDEVLHRELATRDARGEDPGGLLDAANRPGRLYETGDLAVTGLPLNAYLLMKAGVGHAFLEELAEAHLERGDERAALITAERSCRVAPGWARGHGYRALLLERTGQVPEARDAARTALMDPIWTLWHPFDAVAHLAGWDDPITSAPFHRLAEDPRRAPHDRAAHLLDALCVDGAGYDDARPALAALYAQADLPRIARLVGG